MGRPKKNKTADMPRENKQGPKTPQIEDNSVPSTTMTAPPVNPVPDDESAEVPVKEIEDDPENILKEIDADTWSKGFTIKIRKNQYSQRGMLFSWMAERISHEELKTQSLSETLFDKYGPGIYRLHFKTMSEKDIFPGRKIEFPVGELNYQRPSPGVPVDYSSRQNSPGGYQAQRRSGIPPGPPVDPVKTNPDVVIKKAALEIKKLEIEEKKLDQEMKNVTGGDQNSSLERIVTALGQSFKESIDKITVAMAPKQDDNKFERQLADVQREIKESKSKSEQDTLFKFMFEMMMNSQKTMSESQTNMMREFIAQQNKGKDSVNSFKEWMHIFETKRKWEREDLGNMPTELPPSEKPWYEGLIQSISTMVQRFSENGTLDKLLEKLNNPPVQPQAGRKYTKEEQDAVIAKMVKDEVERKKELLSATGQIKLSPPANPVQTEPKTSPVIPAGETAAEFNAKKEVVNNMIGVLLKEMILCPRSCTWISVALGSFPDDILLFILKSNDAPELFAVLGKYADPNLMSELKTIISADIVSVDKKKSNWLILGFNALKLEINELLNPTAESITPADNSGTTATIPPADNSGTTTTVPPVIGNVTAPPTPAP